MYTLGVIKKCNHNRSMYHIAEEGEIKNKGVMILSRLPLPQRNLSIQYVDPFYSISVLKRYLI